MKSGEFRPAQQSPLQLFITVIASIFLAEVVAMVIVYELRPMRYPITVLIDAAIMTVLIFPVLYYFSTRPLLKHIQRGDKTESILQARLRLIQYANEHSVDELLQLTLDELESFTGSSIGYLHFLEADQKTLWLRVWSTNTLQHMCALASKDSHYDVDQAGVWTDSIRLRRPVIHNDYPSLPHRKGLPEGHAPIIREMAVPILRDEKIVAIVGLGNKPHTYSADDIEIVSTLADFAWEQVIHKQAADALLTSEEKFRTLVNWTYDWEFWVNPQGGLVYSSPSCEHITGYRAEEFVADPELIGKIVYPEDRAIIERHQQLIHCDSAGAEKVEYRITTRDGKLCWIEHICRPVWGADNQYLGRRVSHRDITGRKTAEHEISERNEKEKLLMQTIHTMQLDIARDLHDTLGQNISFLRMKLDHLAENKISKKAQLQLELMNMARAANESYDLMRGTLAMLQSETSTDLFRLFTRYAEQIQERSSFTITTSSQGQPRFMSAKRMRQLFYIFREILSNIEKHAEASQVVMEMCWNSDHLHLVVADDGKGFDIKQIQPGTHYGLRFMQERAELLNGSLIMKSHPDSGTKVEIQIPYEHT